jgi:phosphoribosylformimino-5-aminoimidazole carboxamide ribotide isomerase
MGDFVVFPAIDLKEGRCVRLRQGDPNRETVYGDSPADVAADWVAQGARWLHVVNLDGAFGNESGAVNRRQLYEIRRRVSVPIQFGGGIRNLKDILTALELGATRVVLGTVAVEKPSEVKEALDYFGEDRIVVGVDARDGVVAVRGWQRSAGVDAISLARQMAEMGVRRVVYTDIARDGMLSGVNVEASLRLAEETGLEVIASGGVASLDDVRRLAMLRDRGIAGVIVGQALYTGAISLREALEVARGG